MQHSVWHVLCIFLDLRQVLKFSTLYQDLHAPWGHPPCSSSWDPPEQWRGLFMLTRTWQSFDFSSDCPFCSVLIFSRICPVPLHDKLPNLFPFEAWICHCLYLFSGNASPHRCLRRRYHHLTMNIISLVGMQMSCFRSVPDTRHLHSGMY